ncbi:unnamed protein product [Caenorhabditis angaria]|uniref:CX domain-containing protein n=1 Tax=Caenorhabditis angaria TaxID=860376 RepID=A0A9P1IKK6_9PELO|nr:unnamed protein product [Caenorhabditis angaria]
MVHFITFILLITILNIIEKINGSNVPRYIMSADYEKGNQHIFLGEQQENDYWRGRPKVSELITICTGNQNVPHKFPKFICGLLYFYRDPVHSRKNFYWAKLFKNVPESVKFLKNVTNYPCPPHQSSIIGFTEKRIHVACSTYLNVKETSRAPRFHISYVIDHGFPTVPYCSEFADEKPCDFRSYFYIRYIIAQDQICCCPTGKICPILVYSQPDVRLPLLILNSEIDAVQKS